jgi:signal peptidase I
MDADRDPTAGGGDGWGTAAAAAFDDTPPLGVLMTEPQEPSEELEIAAPAAGRSRWRRLPRSLRSLIEWGVVIAIALLVALGVRTWVFQPFWIPSGSMENTLEVGDRVLVNKLSYRLHDFNRGDVVVFEQPDSWLLDDDIKDLIKRVIGLPGEEIRIADCAVYIDGRRLVEPYTQGRCTDPAYPVVDPDGDGAFVVPEDMLFVMGDNRTGSQDSRVHGFVPEGNVVGRAFVVIWPQGNWKWL